MSDPNKTIAFRVPQSIVEQVQEMASANGQSKSEWLRDLVMQAIHAAVPKPSADAGKLTQSSELATFLQAIDARMYESEEHIRQEVQALKTAVADAAKRLHDDHCTLGQIGLQVEESIEQRMDTDCLDVLDAIERLKQSQRSHKDSVLRAIIQAAGRPERPGY